MTFSISGFQMFVLPMRTRFPFRYGIASMTALPHLIVEVRVVVDGQAESVGLAADGLAPKWFTKKPELPLEAEFAEMIAVVQNAVRVARHAATQPRGFAVWWRDVYDEMQRWGQHTATPPLLANLGVSLVERAVLDALCKAAATPLHRVLRGGSLGLDLGIVRDSLAGMTAADALVAQPVQRMAVRHTVGLSDALRAADVPAAERVDDGLPMALDECVRAYGLRWFKLKLCGKLELDLPRLRDIAAVLGEGCPQGYRCTLDGNEQYHDIAAFRHAWQAFSADAALRPLLAALQLVEQPLHRDHALDDDVGAALLAWPDAPPLIIDEADGSLADLPRALALGYSGTSHKNCKGVTKGIANAALLRQHAARVPTRAVHLTGEDLVNVGPIALLQDLAVIQALGITHAERNGHHYYRGLSAFPASAQAATLAAHADMYRAMPGAAGGWPALRIAEGMLSTASVNDAAFGYGFALDTSAFEPLNSWIKRGGLGELVG